MPVHVHVHVRLMLCYAWCPSCRVLCCHFLCIRGPVQHEFSVFWVPRRSIAVERILEDEGVYGEVTQVCRMWGQGCRHGTICH
jgi:hypothetical protein